MCPVPNAEGDFVKFAIYHSLSFLIGSIFFVTLKLIAGFRPDFFFDDTLKDVGMLYGVLLFGTGFAAMVAACKPSFARTRTDARWTQTIVTLLPLLIGLLGVVLGYMQMARLSAVLPNEFNLPHGTIWATAVIGLSFTAIAMLIHRCVRLPTMQQKIAST